MTMQKPLIVLYIKDIGCQTGHAEVNINMYALR
jgi:hypothetical protein